MQSAGNPRCTSRVRCGGEGEEVHHPRILEGGKTGVLASAQVTDFVFKGGLRKKLNELPLWR